MRGMGDVAAAGIGFTGGLALIAALYGPIGARALLFGTGLSVAFCLASYAAEAYERAHEDNRRGMRR